MTSVPRQAGRLTKPLMNGKRGAKSGSVEREAEKKTKQTEGGKKKKKR